MRVIVTGATGYVGGRLVPELLDDGHEVRVLTRGPERVRGRSWGGWVEVHEGDLLEPETLEGAFEDVDVAYYLVHSMHAGSDFAERDRQAARNFVEAAEGVGHVVYLGGIVPEGETQSEHLASRAEVGRILREGLPTTEFRAGPVIGSGSGSFEMTRYLTERLPVMVAPKWILNDVQPIAIRDVIAYLSAAVDVQPDGVVEIGSPDVLSFRDMMLIYADVRGLNRFIQPVPVLTPRLAGLWVGLVTPIPNTLALPLIKGIVNPVRAETSRARELFDVEPIGYREAVERALHVVETGRVPTRWSSAMGTPGVEVVDEEGMVRETRTVDVDAPPERVFDVFTGLGGDRGWPGFSWLWRIRGVLDRLVGGPGLSRGRRDPDEVRVGDALDFWRVEDVEPGRRLRLRAEMRVPGEAWLEWTVEPRGEHGSRLVQRSLFAPRGLAGAAYWYGLYPVHGPIFSRMANQIAERAEAQSR
jgi:uncharacterized protein YbjT (DUF2867 family)/uncharacterized protein YndB with AHSA1/START domain